jgi:DNA-binding MarR family transcriptional regulator
MKRKKNSEYKFHPVAPTELAGQLRISRASISRAIAALVAGGVLEKKQGGSTKCPEYALTAAYEPIGDQIKTGNDALKPGCSSVKSG